MDIGAIVMKEGYGGRAGTHQFDEKVINGVRTEEVEARILARVDKFIADIPTHVCTGDE